MSPPVSQDGDVALERALWALRAYDTTALATTGEAGPHVAGVFFAPERTEAGIRLLIATRGGSRLHRELAADPRVAFTCSPGNASRWIQGGGTAAVVDDPADRIDVVRRLIDHAAGAQAYVEGPDVLPVTIAVRWLKVVEARDGPHLLLAFDR
ncbi:MAG TPA: pyridoxamine 5'-phosphate oxidase family protein [Candidatus Saccharimonadales bacterium]|nr:pyridoxamine 5'-phosphate oxidase family protein [Candidatus Saccharimonadales bacterium]